LKLLLDTHTFLWAIGEPQLLTVKTRKLLQDASVERIVSVVSLWEIAIRVRIRRLSMPTDREFYIRKLDDLQARTLPVELRHSFAMFEQPPHHHDPFDRLLIAQAREDGLTVVTRDEVFSDYDVQTIW